jgi:hypothetical protein
MRGVGVHLPSGRATPCDGSIRGQRFFCACRKKLAAGSLIDAFQALQAGFERMDTLQNVLKYRYRFCAPVFFHELQFGYLIWL